MPKERVRVRTYRHGLGDCHLVSFLKADGTYFHVLIDCGVVDATPEPERVMTLVAKDIAKETKNAKTKRAVIDLVVATHQHMDHLSGFLQAKAEFDKMEMKRLWLAWTEEKTKGQKLKEELGRALKAVEQGLAKLKAATCDAAADRVQGVLDFFGALGVEGKKTEAMLDYLHARPGIDIDYLEPGTAFLLPEVPTVRVYVLGPSKDVAQWKITNPRKSKHEGYEDTSVAAEAAGLVSALFPGASETEKEASFPFARTFRRSEAEASEMQLFRDHYGFEKGHVEAWRRIETSWLEVAERLAIALNDLTNNTSLALAFEFIDSGEVLLFPGDAQIGSWLGWQKLVWRVEDDAGKIRKVRIGNLLENTVFYKASHHASHNGTLSELGLEKMEHRDLVVVVPVDKAMSRKKHWDRTLPWDPLLERLAEKSRGRLILTDLKQPAPVAEDLENLDPLERARFAEQVTVKRQWVDYCL